MKQSRTKDIFVLGFAMFAIFFGAGNLIFPPSIGIHSGGDVVWGIAGMTLTGIIFPMLAMVGVPRAEDACWHASASDGAGCHDAIEPPLSLGRCEP